MVRPGNRLLAKDIIDPMFLLIIVINYGVKLMMALGGARMESTVQEIVKSRCHDFLVKTCTHVQQRLPANIPIWKSMTLFSLTIILVIWQLLKCGIRLPGDKDDNQAEMFCVEELNYKDDSGHQMLLYPLCSDIACDPFEQCRYRTEEPGQDQTEEQDKIRNNHSPVAACCYQW